MKTINFKQTLKSIAIISAIASFNINSCFAQTNSTFNSPNGADPKTIDVPHGIPPLPPVPNPDPIPPRYIPPRFVQPPGYHVDFPIINNNGTGRISNDDNDNLINQSGEANESGNDFQSNNLRIFPNPGVGTFTVNFHLDTQGDLNVRVIDVEGREIFSQNFNDFIGDYSNSFDLTDKGRGIYILSIEQNNKMISKKIVID